MGGYKLVESVFVGQAVSSTIIGLLVVLHVFEVALRQAPN